ncbi:hypothetical protein [uncultured Sphingomonas sp.]|uniref:hypothetical protein n=1 Tax=uncultured Sphingomonas sp. TaxID=158754 RepID=UPI0026021349|nr:hypothetical protein [uncultured Sphingomonas sp.]
MGDDDVTGHCERLAAQESTVDIFETGMQTAISNMNNDMKAVKWVSRPLRRYRWPAPA